MKIAREYRQDSVTGRMICPGEFYNEEQSEQNQEAKEPIEKEENEQKNKKR